MHFLELIRRKRNGKKKVYRSNTFKNGVELDEGDYALVTGTRLANGGVLSEMQLFHVKQAETNVVKMYLRTSDTGSGYHFFLGWKSSSSSSLLEAASSAFLSFSASMRWLICS